MDCPQCQKPAGRPLESLNRHTWVDYFRCVECGHSWTRAKAAPESTPGSGSPPRTRRVGGMNYEGRYFIVSVPDIWRPGDPLPDPGPADDWFDDLGTFTAALNGPWSQIPVRRRPWQPSPELNTPKEPAATKPPCDS